MNADPGHIPTVTTRDICAFTWFYWRKNWKLLAITFSLLGLCGFFNFSIVPLYAGKITDIIAQGQENYSLNKFVLWRDVFIFTIAAIAHVISWTFALYAWNLFSSHTLYSVVGDGLHKVQRFSTDWHANTFAGGTVRKITRGMWSFDTFSDRLVVGFFVIIIVMIITVFTIASRLPLVALFMAFIILIYFLLSLYVSRKYLLPLFKRAAEADTSIGSTLADIITGIPTIKTFAAETREDDRFDNVRIEWRTRSLKAWQVARTIDGIRSILRSILLIGMVCISLWLWSHGRATPGDITLVMTCYFLTQSMLRDMGSFINDLQKAMSEMEDIVAFWKRDDDVRDIPGAKELTVSKHGGAITFNNVTFQYKNTTAPVYQNLSVTINPGEKIALVGMSGSGKSTFVKLLERLYDIQDGAITIDDQNIAHVTQESLRKNVALVPQDPILFHRSLADNIAYARPDATFAEIEAAAKQAFAHDFIMTFPDGYDTLVGERGVKLSGGERQRVAIARAILADTPILVLDEATSSLDSLSEHYIQRALDTLMNGRTTITIAHRLATIRAVDRILVFDRGRIVEQGKHDDLIINPNSLYKRLYDMQALGLH